MACLRIPYIAYVAGVQHVDITRIFLTVYDPGFLDEDHFCSSHVSAGSFCAGFSCAKSFWLPNRHWELNRPDVRGQARAQLGCRSSVELPLSCVRLPFDFAELQSQVEERLEDSSELRWVLPWAATNSLISMSRANLKRYWRN